MRKIKITKLILILFLFILLFSGINITIDKSGLKINKNIIKAVFIDPGVGGGGVSGDDDTDDSTSSDSSNQNNDIHPKETEDIYTEIDINDLVKDYIGNNNINISNYQIKKPNENNINNFSEDLIFVNYINSNYSNTIKRETQNKIIKYHYIYKQKIIDFPDNIYIIFSNNIQLNSNKKIVFIQSSNSKINIIFKGKIYGNYKIELISKEGGKIYAYTAYKEDKGKITITTSSSLKGVHSSDFSSNNFYNNYQVPLNKYYFNQKDGKGNIIVPSNDLSGRTISGKTIYSPAIKFNLSRKIGSFVRGGIDLTPTISKIVVNAYLKREDEETFPKNPTFTYTYENGEKISILNVLNDIINNYQIGEFYFTISVTDSNGITLNSDKIKDGNNNFKFIYIRNLISDYDIQLYNKKNEYIDITNNGFENIKVINSDGDLKISLSKLIGAKSISSSCFQEYIKNNMTIKITKYNEAKGWEEVDKSITLIDIDNKKISFHESSNNINNGSPYIDIDISNLINDSIDKEKFKIAVDYSDILLNTVSKSSSYVFIDTKLPEVYVLKNSEVNGFLKDLSNNESVDGYFKDSNNNNIKYINSEFGEEDFIYGDYILDNANNNEINQKEVKGLKFSIVFFDKTSLEISPYGSTEWYDILNQGTSTDIKEIIKNNISLNDTSTNKDDFNISVFVDENKDIVIPDELKDYKIKIYNVEVKYNNEKNAIKYNYFDNRKIEFEINFNLCDYAGNTFNSNSDNTINKTGLNFVDRTFYTPSTKVVATEGLLKKEFILSSLSLMENDDSRYTFRLKLKNEFIKCNKFEVEVLDEHGLNISDENIVYEKDPISTNYYFEIKGLPVNKPINIKINTYYYGFDIENQSKQEKKIEGKQITIDPHAFEAYLQKVIDISPDFNEETDVYIKWTLCPLYTSKSIVVPEGCSLTIAGETKIVLYVPYDVNTSGSLEVENDKKIIVYGTLIIEGNDENGNDFYHVPYISAVDMDTTNNSSPDNNSQNCEKYFGGIYLMDGGNLYLKNLLIDHAYSAIFFEKTENLLMLVNENPYINFIDNNNSNNNSAGYNINGYKDFLTLVINKVSSTYKSEDGNDIPLSSKTLVYFDNVYITNSKVSLLFYSNEGIENIINSAYKDNVIEFFEKYILASYVSDNNNTNNGNINNLIHINTGTLPLVESKILVLNGVRDIILNDLNINTDENLMDLKTYISGYVK